MAAIFCFLSCFPPFSLSIPVRKVQIKYLCVRMVIGILHCDGDDGKQHKKQAQLEKETFANQYRRVDGEATCHALLAPWEAQAPTELHGREDLSLDHQERVWAPRDETED